METIEISDEQFIGYTKNMEQMILNLNLRDCLLKLKDDSFPNYERWKSYILTDYYLYHNNITSAGSIKGYKSTIEREFLSKWSTKAELLANENEETVSSAYVQTARKCLIGAIINYFNRGAIVKVNDEKKELLTRMENKVSFRDNMFGTETFIDINLKDIIKGFDLLGILILPNDYHYRDEENNSKPLLIKGELDEEFKRNFKSISYYYFLKSNTDDNFIISYGSINFTNGLGKKKYNPNINAREIENFLHTKIATIVCNILDFINLPEVIVKRYSTREPRNTRKSSQPDQIQIHLNGKLYRYVYEELPEIIRQIDSGKIPYSQIIRGYFMHFWNKDYYKRLYSMSETEMLEGDYSMANGVLMKTVKMYIKGKGKLIDKSYQIGSDEYFKNQRTMTLAVMDLFPERKISMNNRTILNGLELDCVVYDDDKIVFAVEYDGYQHSNFPNIFHETRQDFDEQVERDRLKDKMCKDMGIKLIRVPYTLGGETERILSRKEILDFLIVELNKLNIK